MKLKLEESLLRNRYTLCNARTFNKDLSCLYFFRKVFEDYTIEILFYKFQKMEINLKLIGREFKLELNNMNGCSVFDIEEYCEKVYNFLGLK